MLRIEQWSLGRVAREMEGRLISPRVEAGTVKAVSTDTRNLAGGELFVALRGERFDGHDFVEQALQAGAKAVVVDDRQAIGPDQVGIVVDDTLAALSRLGHALWVEARQQGLHAVAVTGSNGKTTTKELLAALWSTQGPVWSTPGNFNNHIGVPLTLCALPVECDHLIVEMGANHKGEISSLVELAPADERIITSIGKAHLEGFGSLAGVRRAKSEIFAHANRATAAIVPFDEKDKVIPEEFRGRVFSFGETEDADVRVQVGDVRFLGGQAQMEVKLEVDSRKWTLSLPLVGRHNAFNLAAALTTLLHQNVWLEEEELNQALAGIKLPQGRFRTWSVGELEILDDAYNANPSSMRASFEAFEHWCAASTTRRIAVIGEMLELGDVADQEHSSLARWLAERPGLDGVAFYGAFAEMMGKTLRECGKGIEVLACADHQEIVEWLAQCGPSRVFLKGSRGNRLEEVVTLLKAQLATDEAR